MKNNLSIQLSSGTNMMITGQVFSRHNDITHEDPGYANKFLPAKMSASFGSVSPVTKISGKETGVSSFFNMPLNLVAARLSEIELALDCYDVSHLRFATHDLKNLIPDQGMPAIYRLAVQMEELAGESQLREIKNLLREIKKIIGWIVKHRKQSRTDNF